MLKPKVDNAFPQVTGRLHGEFVVANDVFFLQEFRWRFFKATFSDLLFDK